MAEISEREIVSKYSVNILQRLVILTKLCLFYLQLMFLLLYLLYASVEITNLCLACSVRNGIAKKLLKSMTKMKKETEFFFSVKK